MMARVMMFLTLAATGFAINLQGSSTLQFDVEDAKNRPVTKVVTLLKDMLVQLEKEAEEDQEIYDSLVCWCTTNDKDKVKSIDDAEAHIEDLTTEIEELTALASRLTTEIANLEGEIKKNEDALAKAKAMREKELAEFGTMEADSLTSIDQLGGAITALSKHHPGAALLQTSKRQLHDVATIVQKEMQKNAKLLEGVIAPSQKKMIAAFLQQPASAGSYAPASGAIFGILKQMKETFENDLSQAQKDELSSQKAYEELKAAKEAEIAAAQEQVTTKTQELATAEEKKAQAEQDKADTMESLDADQKYLVNLKEKCSLTDKEFEERLKTRQLEMQAVSKAMAVLTSDDAADLFASSLGFVQKESTANLKSKRRADASKLLAVLARKYNNPHLMTLAMKVKLDAFTKVKQAIDDMIAELAKQQEDEIKLKDYCVNGFNENEKQTNQKTREKTDLETLIEDLTMKIEELHKAIETLKAEVKEMQVEMKRASEDREKENKEFQQTVAEQRATQVLLTKALDVLKGFYEKAALVQLQKKEPAGPPPPPGFKEYKKNSAAGGVMTMIQQIINDAKAMEEEAIKGEEDATKAYEVFVTDTNASIDAKAKEIVEKSEEKAKTEAARTEAEEQKAEVLAALEGLSNENADLHKECDYVLKNFDVRQTARGEEIEALKQAKAILSGSKFGEFLAIGSKK
jgi:predicted  nucleic acid-binding Zn-ribbon protein